ncbi:DEKNAAC104263 [Brettanomyces naardenensis]|uniref:DEKNAAC104263 n=1 Tax=Brettanomyces naardenensis TaxID=13370 RepID=A0A448YPV4_BRENA|nr:DEKNAAC104263 [Brettanomyces naardenensis]
MPSTPGKGNAEHLLQIFREPDDERDDDFLEDDELETITHRLRSSKVEDLAKDPKEPSGPLRQWSDELSNRHRSATTAPTTMESGSRKPKNKYPAVNPNSTLRNWTIKVAHRISDLSVPEFEQFEKVALLGKGAFGQVYKVHHEPSGRMFAMKTVRFVSDDEDVDAILKEILIMKNLDHPNIVRLYHYHLDQRELNLILEFCSGGSLRTIIRNRGGLPELQVVQYTRQILEGLCYLHLNGIIHRDIKAANILLNDGTVKLADFGVSLNMNDDDNEQAKREPNGSVYWMAPEVIRLEGASMASDIWSLGATVFELLTGDPPFSRYDPLPACHAIGVGEQIEYPESISTLCRSFLEKSCLVHDPDMRQSAASLRKHPWIFRKESLTGDSHNSRLAQYREDAQDFDDYEDQFETATFDRLKTAKERKVEMYRETSENFAEGFDFVGDEDLTTQSRLSPIEDQVRLARNIQNCTVQELRKLQDFENPLLVKSLVESNFVLHLVFILNGDRENAQKLEMVRIASRLFEKHPASIDEFCYSGCVPLGLALYDEDPKVVYEFIALLASSKTGIQSLVSSGAHVFATSLLNKSGGQRRKFAVHLILEMFRHEKTRKDQLAVAMIANSTPLILSSILAGILSSHDEDALNDAISDINYIYEYSSPAYRKLFLNVRFYRNIFRTFHGLPLASRFKALRMLVNDDDYKSVIGSLDGVSTILRLLIRDLITSNSDSFSSYGIFVRYGIDFIDTACSLKKENEDDLLDFGGMDFFQHLLRNIDKKKGGANASLKDRLAKLLINVSKSSKVRHDPSLSRQLFDTFWLLVDDRSWGTVALTNILQINDGANRRTFARTLANQENLNRLIRGLKHSAHFEEFLGLLEQTIEVELSVRPNSSLVDAIAKSETVMDSLSRRLLSDRYNTKTVLSFIYILYENNRPLSDRLTSLKGSLTSLRDSLRSSSGNKESIELLDEIIHIILSESS